MTNEEIKQLIQIVVESGVAELEVQRGENRVRIRRSNGGSGEFVAPAAPAPQAPPAAAPAYTSPPLPPAAALPDNSMLVKSPIVGTFYDCSAPGTAPFVRVGDSVEPGQVLCIIESMKLMNEIEAETAGTIVSKLMENGRPVEYGEALFDLRPR